MIPSLGSAVVLVLALAAAPAHGDVRATPLEGPAPRRPEYPRGSGAIAYVTGGRAYLDVGAADGLAPGAVVTARRGDQVARCAVDLVAEHAASCPSAAFRVGDRVAFDPGPAPPEPKILPAVVAEEDLDRRAALLSAAPAPPPVEFKTTAVPGAAPQPVVRRARWLFAEAGWAQWSSSGAPGLGAASVDLGIRGAPIGAGLVLDVAARAERWLPDPNPRYRAGEATRFYLWQAEVTAPLSRFSLSAGRVLPYAIPGATVFDGASASTQLGPAQVGLFGGLVPAPETLLPGTDRATGGAFWSYAHAFGGGAGLRQDGRLAVVRTPELGSRFEATVGAGAWWKAAYVSAEAQLGTGGTAPAAPGLLDAFRADLTLQVARGLSVGGGFRHTGFDGWPDAAAGWEPARFPGRSDAGDGWVSWDVSVLRVGARAGFSRDVRSGLERSWAGPELGIPRLLGRYGGVSAGYLEEWGWLAGRSAWVQATVRPGPRVNLGLRGTWSYASDAAVDANELGLVAFGSAELGRGFGIRASLLSRAAVGLGEGEGGGSTPLGVTGTVGLYASY